MNASASTFDIHQDTRIISGMDLEDRFAILARVAGANARTTAQERAIPRRQPFDANPVTLTKMDLVTVIQLRVDGGQQAILVRGEKWLSESIVRSAKQTLKGFRASTLNSLTEVTATWQTNGWESGQADRLLMFHEWAMRDPQRTAVDDLAAMAGIAAVSDQAGISRAVFTKTNEAGSHDHGPLVRYERLRDSIVGTIRLRMPRLNGYGADLQHRLPGHIASAGLASHFAETLRLSSAASFAAAYD